MAGRPHTVGFDLDMTLADTREGVCASWAEVALRTGVPVDAVAAAARIGPPLEHEAARWFPAADVLDVCLLYRLIYAELGPAGSVPLPGAADALATVHATGGRVVVVTAKRGDLAVAVLRQCGLQVDAVHGQLWADGKAVALRSEGAEVYVGDAPADVEGARAAGAVAVGVLTGPFPPLAADALLPDLRAFSAWHRDWLGTDRP